MGTWGDCRARSAQPGSSAVVAMMVAPGTTGKLVLGADRGSDGQAAGAGPRGGQAGAQVEQRSRNLLPGETSEHDPQCRY